MTDRPIASDLSYFVLQQRRQRNEFGASALDSVNQRLYAIPSLLANRRAFIADPDQDTADGPNPNPITAALGARD